MGYREDGNFNVTWSEGITQGKGKTNPTFIYPDKSIRFLEAEDALNERHGNNRNKSLSYKPHEIHRGYIRNIGQPSLGAVVISKCNFQFNPQEIRQSIAMREDIYIPILQNPAQLGQPIGAQANFTFDLLFDRTHEMSSGRYAINSRELEGTARREFMSQSTDPLNQDPEHDVYDIGVFADLRVLYSVIGQGFSKELIEAQYASLVEGASEYYRRNFGSSTETNTTDGESPAATSSDGPAVDAAGRVTASDDIAKTIDANYGNWAILLPNPVRVMFSSLFMVDGFVTGTNVDFLKFNTKMVPTQCRVTMNVAASYIGFAREKTFLTKILEDAAKAREDAYKEAEAALEEIRAALNGTGSQFFMALGLGVRTSSFDKAVSGNWEDGSGVWRYVVKDNVDVYSGDKAEDRRRIYLGFPKVKPNRAEGKDTDDILALYEADVSLQIGYKWSFRIYGGKAYNTRLTSADSARALLVNSTYTSAEGITLLGDFYGEENATDKETWGSGTAGEGTGQSRVRRRTINTNGNSGGADSETIQNSASNAYYFDSGVPDWVKDAYYIIEYEVNLTASNGGGTATANRKYATVVTGREETLRQRFILDWVGGADSPIPSIFSRLPSVGES